MTELTLPTGSGSNSGSSHGNNTATAATVNSTSSITSSPPPPPPILTQSSTGGGDLEGNENELPLNFIQQLSSGPIHQFLSQNTFKSDLTPRQVRDSLATLDSVKQLESQHDLTIDYNDKVHKKQLSNAIKEVWETLGELDSDQDHQDPTSTAVAASSSNDADLSKDAALAWKLNKEMMAQARPTRNGSQTTSDGKMSKKTKGNTQSKGSVKSTAGSKRSIDDEIDSDEDPDPESGGASPSTSKGGPKKKKKKNEKGGAAKEKKPPNPNNPFNRPLILDAKMAEICGASELPRHGVTKQLWAYIKGKDLQDPSNKRRILCDEKLESLFGKKSVDSFEMAKLIGSHLSKKEELV